MHDTIQKAIDRRFLQVCTPQQAHDWLASRPRPGIHRNSVDTLSYQSEAEIILVDRSDHLIDYSLARYGFNAEAAAKLYPLLDAEGRKIMRACHRAGGGPITSFVGDNVDFSSAEVFDEFVFWVTNKDIGDDLLETLFSRTAYFARFSDVQYQHLLQWVASNPRMRMPYETDHLDGYDEFSYNKVFDLAWALGGTVPANQEWASALWNLFEVLHPTSFTLDVDEALKRWDIDDKEGKVDEGYGFSASFHIRSSIARLKVGDDTRILSDDLAIRCAFYRECDPATFPNWMDYAARDTAMFFEQVVINDNFWRDEQYRSLLNHVAWHIPDKHSTMDAPNRLKYVEIQKRKEHPEWFAEQPFEAWQEPSKPREPEPAKKKSIFRFGLPD